MLCTRCGKQINDGAQACFFCGYPVMGNPITGAQPQQTQQPPPPQQPLQWQNQQGYIQQVHNQPQYNGQGHLPNAYPVQQPPPIAQRSTLPGRVKAKKQYGTGCLFAVGGASFASGIAFVVIIILIAAFSSNDAVTMSNDSRESAPPVAAVKTPLTTSTAWVAPTQTVGGTLEPTPIATSEPTPEPTLEPTPIPTPEPGTGRVDGHDVSIKSAKLTHDRNGEPALIVNYEWTNNSNEPKAFMYTLDACVFQDGIECVKPFLGIDGENDKRSVSIQPKASLEFSVGYILNNTSSDMVVEVRALWDFYNNKRVVRRTFEFNE